jgi:hypothetical protein
MAAQRRGSVKVFVQPEKDSLEAMATLFFSSRSVLLAEVRLRYAVTLYSGIWEHQPLCGTVRTA